MPEEEESIQEQLLAIERMLSGEGKGKRPPSPRASAAAPRAPTFEVPVLGSKLREKDISVASVPERREVSPSGERTHGEIQDIIKGNEKGITHVADLKGFGRIKSGYVRLALGTTDLTKIRRLGKRDEYYALLLSFRAVTAGTGRFRFSKRDIERIFGIAR